MELIHQGYGQHRLARELDMPVQTAEEWIMLVRSAGVEAVMGASGKKMYPYEIKLAAVRDVIDQGMSLPQVMAKYGIASRSPVTHWCSKYRAGGAEALRAKPQGRPKGSGNKPPLRSSPEQALRDQVSYLQAKVAYLEKLHALQAEDRSRTGRKPW